MSKKRIHISRIWKKLLRFLRLSPLSLAVKCQLMFGLAVVFTLILALAVPYIWMYQLVKKDYLDTERARTDTLLYREHFVPRKQSDPAILDQTGRELDPNSMRIRWIRFSQENIEDQQQLQQLSLQQQLTVEQLRDEDSRIDTIRFEKINGITHSNYTRIVRVNDNCIGCHNPEGTAVAFSPGEAVGVVVAVRQADELGKITFLNCFWAGTAGLIAGIGAIISFYWITQRVILRPIRQLRAMANNVADGNLDIRSTISTGDEYEKLADAFNHMLDHLQKTQEKLRLANIQLDAKIVQLSERNIELFKANKLKSEFLANISHEFRTPLNSILGFAQVLREKTGKLAGDKAQRYAENIITGGNRLLNMINDLLDLAKTKAGKLELHIGQSSVDVLLKELISQFSLLTNEKKIKVRLDVDSDLPQLITDIGKVQQILYNLLSNAVKFTPERGRIEVRASLGLDDKTLRISVTDTGCGIAQKDKEKIFEKFTTADGSLTRKTTGSGLGLAISAELASMLAGGIGVESEPDKGSTFWLDIPITLVQQQVQG